MCRRIRADEYGSHPWLNVPRGLAGEPEYMTGVQYFGTHALDQICPDCWGQLRSGVQDAVTARNDGPGTRLLPHEKAPGEVPGGPVGTEPI